MKQQPLVRLLASRSAAGALLLAPLFLAACVSVRLDRVETAAPTRHWALDVRNASVFAGACHYGGERMLAGESAVLAWRLAPSSVDGQAFGGADVVATLRAEGNLADNGPRQSCVYLDPKLDARQAQLAMDWLRAHAKTALGTIVSVEREPLVVEIDGASYRVKAGARVDLEGGALPDLACCKMPYDVWYAPLLALDRNERRVGNTARLAVREPELELEFVRHGENDAWFGALAVD